MYVARGTVGAIRAISACCLALTRDGSLTVTTPGLHTSLDVRAQTDDVIWPADEEDTSTLSEMRSFVWPSGRLAGPSSRS